MARLSATKKKDEADRRSQAVLDCATKTLGLLRERAAIPVSTQPEIQRFIAQSLPLPSTTALTGKSRTLDSLGTDLWNAAANLLREEEPQHDPRQKPPNVAALGVTIRVFALLLLETAFRASSRQGKDPDQRIRIFKVSVNAARLCLDHNELELASTALERCAEHATLASEVPPVIQISHPADEEADDCDVILKTLSAEYLLLRLLLAWKSVRLDVAEHFYTKFASVDKTAAQRVAEKAADVFFELAKSILKSDAPDNASVWFERALTALNTCDIDELSQDVVELKLSICVSFVELLLSSNHHKDHDRAMEIVDHLSNLHALRGRITICILHFRVLAVQTPVNDERILNVLMRMIKLAVLSEQNLKMIMHTLHKAVRISPTAALTALRAFIITRLLSELSAAQQGESMADVWIEKATVAYVLLATSQMAKSPLSDLSDLKSLLDTVLRQTRRVFSAKATHAAQTLIWKAVSRTNAKNATICLELLRHDVFDNAGLHNKAKIGRKIMYNALADKQPAAAREAFYSIPEIGRGDDCTSFLAFRVALESDDLDLASKSLRMIAKNAHKDPTYLYGCVLEAQKSNMRGMAVAALQAILDQRPHGIHLPTLLRCTARLLLAETEAQGRDLSEIFTEIIQIFETAAASMEEVRRESHQRWRVEVQWWSKNTYNHALRFCTDVPPQDVVRLITVCIRFLDQVPADGGPMHRIEIERRRLSCLFLSTSALIALGRSGEDGTEHMLQCYLHAQKQIDSFKTVCKNVPPPTDREETSREHQRMLEMLKFDLECVLKLQQWERLPSVLQACLAVPETDRWGTLADLLIVMHDKMDAMAKDPQMTGLLMELLQKCINESWKKDRDITKAARWLRFTFTMCLDDVQNRLSLQLLQQAAGMAKHASGHEDRDVYPEAELHWLAATSFNHAVDLFQNGQAEACTEWIQGALDLAYWAQDNGQLHAALTGQREQARTLTGNAEL